jgi:hypothetical protein
MTKYTNCPPAVQRQLSPVGQDATQHNQSEKPRAISAAPRLEHACSSDPENPTGQSAVTKPWQPVATAAIKSAGSGVPIPTRDHRCRVTPGAVKMAVPQVSRTTTYP